MTPIDPRLLRHAAAARVLLVVTVVLGTLAAVAVVGQAWIVATVVARVIQRGDGVGEASPLAPLVIALAAVFVARSLLVWAQAVASRRAAASVKTTLRRRFVRRVALAGPDDPVRVGRADTATAAVDGLDALDAWFADYLPQLVLAAVVPAIVVAQLAFVDRTAMLTVSLTLPLIPVFMVLVGRTTAAMQQSRWRALARLSHHFLDVVEGMPTLRAFGRGEAQVDQVRSSTDRYRTTTVQTLRVAFLSSLVLELLATLSVALVAVGVGLRLVHGDLDLRTGMFLILVAPEAYLPLRQVGSHYHASAAGVAAADAVLAVIDAPSGDRARCAGVPALGPEARIELRGVTVRHAGRDRPAPDRADVVLRSGEVVAVAGPSGVGKSTLVSTLLGFRRPDEGAVRVVDGDGREVDLADVPLEAWRSRVAWVDQHPFVRAGTVEDNLRQGRPDADVVELRAVLDRVGLGLALHREVGEGGRDLSAGERRRLVLARELLREADVLVLDEVTAGLDAETEALVLDVARAEADRGAAVLVVAHRPAVLATADRVVRLR